MTDIKWKMSAKCMSLKCLQNVFKVSLVCLPDEERVGQIEREKKSDLKNKN